MKKAQWHKNALLWLGYQEQEQVRLSEEVHQVWLGT